MRPLLVLVLALSSFPAHAHIGSPNVFFEGKAGPYPVHIVIRPAEVIPGLAEISVRVEAAGIRRVTALPMKWNTGRRGAPPPDVARLVSGETNLYNAQLWFMEGGSQSVELEVTGPLGAGKVTVPVDAVARRVLGMPGSLGATLVVLGLVLVGLLVSIVGAAVRQSVLAPGVEATARRRWGARGAMAVAVLILATALWVGKKWWDGEAANYLHNRLYKPLSSEARVRAENARRILRLQIKDPRFARAAPIIPDHGKLIHLFLVREPSLDVFAHLHPVRRDRKTFECSLPALPEGDYRIYADFTYETGFSDTVTTSVKVPAPNTAASDATSADSAMSDPDDSWRSATESDPKLQQGQCRVGSEYVMAWLSPSRIVVK